VQILIKARRDTSRQTCVFTSDGIYWSRSTFWCIWGLKHPCTIFHARVGLCGSIKKHTGTRYTKVVFLHLVGSTGCRCFLHWQDIGWSRSRILVLRWSCELRRTTKHTTIYLGYYPFYKIIALRPAFLCIEDE
jgi:hypothetical protein